MHYFARRMAPKHYKVARKETRDMLKAAIIAPSSAAWSFPVAIATRKDGKSRIYVYYQVFNQKMEAYRFLLCKIQEIFDKLARGVF